jgi:hypothetical protein
MRSIIKTGRANGYSDAAIKQVLRNKGYKVADINAEMIVNVDPLTILPAEFADVEGGVREGRKLFSRTRHKLAQWAKSSKRKPTPIQTRAMAIEMLKADPIFIAQNKTTQMKLIAAFDSSVSNPVGVRIQRAMDRLVADLKSKQRVIAEKELTAAKVRLKNIVSQMLPGVDVLSAKSAEQIMGIIANATQDSLLVDLEKIATLIDKQREKMRAESVRKMQELLSKKAKKAMTSSGKVRSGGLDEIGQSFFEVAKKIYNSMKGDRALYDKYAKDVEAATISGDLGDIFIKQQAGEPLTLAESELADAAVALDMFEDFNSMDVEQVNDIIEVLETMRGESIKRLKVARAVRSEGYKNLADAAERQVMAMAPELYRPDGSRRDAVQEQSQIKSLLLKGRVFKSLKKLKERWKYMPGMGIKQYLRAQLLHLHSFCNDIDDHSRGMTFFTDNVYRPLNRAIEKAQAGYYKQMSTLDSMANTIPGVRNGYTQIKRMVSDGKVIKVVMGAGVRKVEKGGKIIEQFFSEGESLNMTKNMMLRVYALSLNSTQRAKLANMGFNDNVIEFIKGELGSEPVAFADLIVEYLSDDYFNSVNDIYKFVNNVNLGHQSNYFPTITKPVSVDKSMIEDGDFNGIFNAETSPSLKERVDTTGEVDINFDFTEVLEEYFKSMERYKAFATTVKNLNAIFKNGSVDNYITQLGIKPVMKKLVNYAVNPNAGAKRTSTFLSKIAIKYTGVALAFKLMQIPKQMISSFPNAFEDYSYFGKDSKVPGVIKTPVDMLMFTLDTAVVLATLPKWMKMAYKESATFRKRWDDGVDGDIYGITGGNRVYVPIDKAMNWKGYLRRGVRRASGMPTMIGDFGGIAAYLVNYRRDIMNGMKKEDALEKFNDYNATAQSKRETEKNSLQMSNNELTQFFTMFSSTAFLQINKCYMAWNNMEKSVLGSGKPPRAKDMRAFVINFGLSNALFIAAANIVKLMSGTKEDEEEVLDKMKEALMGIELLKQMPGFGAAVEKSMNIYELWNAGTPEEKAAAKKKLFRTSSDALDPLLSIAQRVEKGAKDEDMTLAAKPIFEFLLGTSIDPAIGIYKGFNEGFNEDNLYDIIGVSKSYRPSEPEPYKPPKQMSKEKLERYYPEVYEEQYGKKDEQYDGQSEIDAILKEQEELIQEEMDNAFGYEKDK